MFSVIETPNRWPLPKATFSLAHVAHLYDLAILVYFCCIINHHIFTGLKQYSLISSQLFYVASPIIARLNSSCSGSQKAKIKVLAEQSSCSEPWEKNQLPSLYSYCRIKFLGLRSQFPCWFSAPRGYSQVFFHVAHLFLNQEPCFNSCMPEIFLISSSTAHQ